ncbi:unnamed protein product [Pelagomonas calceolata]|uniref:Uncharacterized protein n=1 Tax=Pelagomonas calceolata TaxID=35677 RepID=A0A8J2S2Z0_9STRA|nr:unnamed protein product [Pelagomonas calceolata]
MRRWASSVPSRSCSRHAATRRSSRVCARPRSVCCVSSSWESATVRWSMRRWSRPLALASAAAMKRPPRVLCARYFRSWTSPAGPRARTSPTRPYRPSARPKWSVPS